MLKKRAETGSLHLFVQPIFPQSRDSKAQPTAIACQTPNSPPVTRSATQSTNPTKVENLEVVVEPAVTSPPTEEKTRESDRLSELRDIVMDDNTLSVTSGTLPSMCLDAIQSGTLRSTEIKKVLRKMEKVEVVKTTDVYVSPCRAIVRKYKDSGAYCIPSEGRVKNMCIENFYVD